MIAPPRQSVGMLLCRLGWTALLVLAVLGAPPAVARENDEFGEKEALARSQAAIGRSVGDYVLRDAVNREVPLSRFRGRPLVVSFIYTRCADACPVTTRTLADAAEEAQDTLGEDAFSIVTVGFDVASDTPERMQMFARQQGADLSNWRFLSGDLPSVVGLADDLGFVFYRSPKGFDHLFQTTIIDGEGRVYRQVYGAGFETPLLVEPLKELVFGTAAPFSSFEDLVKKVRLFCTIYDPAADRYRFDYSIFIQLIVGTVIILFMIGFIVRNLVRLRRRRSDGTAA
ncbi:MAG: SCO family protein [Rhodospirillales bacterium]|jgi:protein SCO1/2|nr:SCO family protein [Rhodospirillales bacterium]